MSLFGDVSSSRYLCELSGAMSKVSVDSCYLTPRQIWTERIRGLETDASHPGACATTISRPSTCLDGHDA